MTLNFSAKLARKTFKLAHKIIWFASWNTCVPFQLVDKTDLRVKLFENKWKLYCWHLANWIIHFAFIFQWATFIFQVLSQSFSEKLAVHLLYLVSTSFAFVYMKAMYLKPQEAIFMLNQQVSLLESLQGQFNLERFVKRHKLDSYCHYCILPGLGLPSYNVWAKPFIMFSLNYMVLLCSGIWSTLVMSYVVNPERSCYLYFYLPAVLRQSPSVYGICLAYEAICMMWAMSILVTFYVFWSTDLFMLNHILKHLA